MEMVDLKLISKLFAFPFLVVITITPFAALVPQSAAAEAPFKTCTLAISSGLISFRRLCWVVPPLDSPLLSPEMGTPSNIINGSNPLVMVLCPLINIWEAAPGSPEVLEILTPEAFPAKASTKPTSPETAIFSPLILEVA